MSIRTHICSSFLIMKDAKHGPGVNFSLPPNSAQHRPYMYMSGHVCPWNVERCFVYWYGQSNGMIGQYALWWHMLLGSLLHVQYLILLWSSDICSESFVTTGPLDHQLWQMWWSFLLLHWPQASGLPLISTPGAALLLFTMLWFSIGSWLNRNPLEAELRYTLLISFRWK